MKIVLVTYGSRGDVQPMLALSLALQKAGHDVLLVGPPEKREWARQLNCPYACLGADVTAVIDSMEDVTSIRSIIAFISLIREQMAVQFNDLPELIAGADLVLGASLTFALPSIAEAMSISYRYIAFTPQLFVSGAHPCVLFKTQRLPEWMNRMSWHLVRLIDKFNMTARLNQLRTENGLKPVDDIWNNLLGKEVIVACDKSTFPVPNDIQVNYCQTGYFHLQYPQSSQMKDQYCAHQRSEFQENQRIVARFIAKGGPLIYVGFGSMPPKDQIRVLPKIISALRLVGVRAIIGKFWDDASEPNDSCDLLSNSLNNAFNHSLEIASANSDILMLKQYPHLHLFPQMDAVVHHGGAGTTATCLASGVPQIIVPHILDQYYHAHLIYKADLGPPPIWRQHLTQKKLAHAVNAVLDNKKFKFNTHQIKNKIDINTNIKKGIAFIESIIGQSAD